MEEIGKGIGKDARNAVRGYIDDRVEIARKTVQDVESRIRTGTPVILEWSVPFGFSNEFGEKSKKERIGIIRKAMGNFTQYQKFSSNRFSK